MVATVPNNMNFSKITLGTVQFGMKYGIANTGGQPSLTEVCDILRHAYDHHINTLDTAAAYGSSEEVVGSALKQLGLTNRMQIISKVPPIQATTAAEAEREIEATILTSLKRLQVARLSACLLHRESDLPFLPILQKMVDRGLIGAAGVSLDSAQHLAAALESTVIQLPYNILDRRFDAFWPLARSRGITIFARSVYLQGALVMPIANLPPHLRAIAPLRAKLAAIADAAAITLAELCMRFVLSNDAIGSVVTGVDTVAQLSENLRLAAAGPLSATTLKLIADAIPPLPEAVVRPALWSAPPSSHNAPATTNVPSPAAHQ